MFYNKNILVSDSIFMHRLWNRNTLMVMFLLARILISIWNVYCFASFKMKFYSVLMLQVQLLSFAKICAFLFYAKHFRILKRRINNSDGYFESKLSVEMIYRKRMRCFTLVLLTFFMICAMAVLTFPKIFGMDLPVTFPVQLPFTGWESLPVSTKIIDNKLALTALRFIS